jgi:hypothetical protein
MPVMVRGTIAPRSELRSTVVDLVQWITRTLQSHEAISVLGL